MSAQIKEAPYRELLIGCGANHSKQIYRKQDDPKWQSLTTLDIEKSHDPDVVWDLNVVPWPFADGEFDEIHAYEVLEHIGKQGDYESFFAHFSEIHRILKPDGLLYASCPMWDSPWAWSDPGHTRIISKHSLMFLCQKQYDDQVGKSAMSDYRRVFKADFDILAVDEKEHQFSFVLRALK